MATFISRVLPSSVANIPEIESARKFKKVDDNKHTFLCSRLFSPIATSYSHSPSEH